MNTLVTRAVNERASDLHIEPGERDLRVRFRIDGVLHEVMTTPRSVAGAVVSRLKIMADLDISERRVPQDGRVSLKVAGRAIDLRVATLPSIAGLHHPRRDPQGGGLMPDPKVERQLGQLLVDRRLLTVDDLEDGLVTAARNGTSFGSHFVTTGRVLAKDLLATVAGRLGLAFEDVTEALPDPAGARPSRSANRCVKRSSPDPDRRGRSARGRRSPTRSTMRRPEL